jgi:hypothetical protein
VQAPPAVGSSATFRTRVVDLHGAIVSARVDGPFGRG